MNVVKDPSAYAVKAFLKLLSRIHLLFDRMLIFSINYYFSVFIRDF